MDGKSYASLKAMMRIGLRGWIYIVQQILMSAFKTILIWS
jgi:hypothetical protein